MSRPVSVDRPRAIPLTAERVAMVRDGITPPLRALVTLAAGTGMRQGELLGLTVDRIDFERGEVHVDPTRLSRFRSTADASCRTPTRAGRVGVRLRRRTDHAPGLRPRLAPGSAGRRMARRNRRPSAAALLRLTAHPVRRVHQDREGATRSCDCGRDPRHLQPPVAGLLGPHPRSDRRRPRVCPRARNEVRASDSDRARHDATNGPSTGTNSVSIRVGARRYRQTRDA